MKAKPKLPAEFSHVNMWAGCYYIVHGLLLWLGSATIAHVLYVSDVLPLAVRVPLAAIGIIAAAFGMFYLGSLGHEGFHGNLCKHRDASMLMGIFASLGAPLFLSVGVNIYHWRHHMLTNTEDDPDYRLYVRNRSLLSRLRVPLDTSLYSARNLFKLIMGFGSLARSFPFPERRMRLYGALDLLLVVGLTTFYAVLLVTRPEIFLFYVGFPALAANLYWSIHPYIEHGGTGRTEGHTARNCTSIVYRVLLLGYTYHLCHHLYPKVQTHKLPALERYLRQVGYFDDATPEEPRFLGAIRAGMTKGLVQGA